MSASAGPAQRLAAPGEGLLRQAEGERIGPATYTGHLRQAPEQGQPQPRHRPGRRRGCRPRRRPASPPSLDGPARKSSSTATPILWRATIASICSLRRASWTRSPCRGALRGIDVRTTSAGAAFAGSRCRMMSGALETPARCGGSRILARRRGPGDAGQADARAGDRGGRRGETRQQLGPGHPVRPASLLHVPAPAPSPTSWTAARIEAAICGFGRPGGALDLREALAGRTRRPSAICRERDGTHPRAVQHLSTVPGQRRASSWPACSGPVCPSSEGGGSSVYTCMHAGLAPPVNFEASRGQRRRAISVLLPRVDPETIRAAVRGLSARRPATLAAMAQAAREQARRVSRARSSPRPAGGAAVEALADGSAPAADAGAARSARAVGRARQPRGRGATETAARRRRNLPLAITSTMLALSLWRPDRPGEP